MSDYYVVELLIVVFMALFVFSRSRIFRVSIVILMFAANMLILFHGVRNVPRNLTVPKNITQDEHVYWFRGVSDCQNRVNKYIPTLILFNGCACFMAIFTMRNKSQKTVT